MNGYYCVKIGGEFVKKFTNFLIGLLAVAFVFVLRAFFLVGAVNSLITIGFCIWRIVTRVAYDVNRVNIAVDSFTLVANMTFLFLSNLMGVGFADIIKLVNIILASGKQSAKKVNDRMGESGVFKNE